MEDADIRQDQRDAVRKFMGSAELRPGTYWFVLSFKWWKKWKSFVDYDEQSCFPPGTSRRLRRQSSWDCSTPGEITNQALEDHEQPGTLRRGLQENYDFVIVPSPVWRRISTWYGGGPEFKRSVVCRAPSGVPNIELYPLLLKVFELGEAAGGGGGAAAEQESCRLTASRAEPYSSLLAKVRAAVGSTTDNKSSETGPLAAPATPARLWVRPWDSGQPWQLVVAATDLCSGGGGGGSSGGSGGSSDDDGELTAAEVCAGEERAELLWERAVVTHDDVTGEAGVTWRMEAPADGFSATEVAEGEGETAAAVASDTTAPTSTIAAPPSTTIASTGASASATSSSSAAAVAAAAASSSVDHAGWLSSLGVGDECDAQDHQERKWYASVVVKRRPPRIKVHFRGWSPRWDEWINTVKYPQRIQPLHSRTHDWRRALSEGAAVDARHGKFWDEASIKQVDGSRVLVHWVNHKPAHDEWLECTSDRLAKSGTHVRRPPPSVSVSASSSRRGSASSGRSNTVGTPLAPGSVGLYNLGNTCFMNSILQCLSALPPLAHFFLSGAFSSQLNQRNALGSGGRLAEAFASLLQQLWSGRFTVVVPHALKQRIAEHAPQFAGREQQDSAELLSFLLDGLHEDVNLVQDKPYVEQRESEGQPDALFAQQCWERHLLRNRSFIVDSMQGQLRSHVRCNVCDRESITFDPFLTLSLPLPVRHDRTIVVTLVRATPPPLTTPQTTPPPLTTPQTTATPLPLTALTTPPTPVLQPTPPPMRPTPPDTAGDDGSGSSGGGGRRRSSGRVVVPAAAVATTAAGVAANGSTGFTAAEVAAGVSRSSRATRYAITLPKQASVRELAAAVSQRCSIPASLLLICDVYQSTVYATFLHSDPVSQIRGNDTIFAYEVLPDPTLPARHAAARALHDAEGIAVGTRVQCRWKTVRGKAYDATVTAVREDGTYDVTYSDGDTDTAVTTQRLVKHLWPPEAAIIPPTTTTASTAATAAPPPSAATAAAESEEGDPSGGTAEAGAEEEEAGGVDAAAEGASCDPTTAASPATATATAAAPPSAASAPATDKGSAFTVGDGDHLEAGFYADALSLVSVPLLQRRPPASLRASSSASLFAHPLILTFRRTITDSELLQLVWNQLAPYVTDAGRFTATTPPYTLRVTSPDGGGAAQRPVRPSSSPLQIRSREALCVQWSEEGYKALDQDKMSEVEAEEDETGQGSDGAGPALNLGTCFQQLSRKEQLDEHNMWYCSKCGEHRPAFKQLQVWSLPELLVLHLKRFQYTQGAYFVHREKIDSFVDFPLRGLDLSAHIAGPQGTGNTGGVGDCDTGGSGEGGDLPAATVSNGALYDLCAVSNHMGGLGGGHYVAHARNWKTGDWFLCDDRTVSAIPPNRHSSIPSASAYVLFYRRRQQGPGEDGGE